MNLPIIIYCYDAYCGWCYGFSPVMKEIELQYREQLQFEVLSGGMIIGEEKHHIGLIANYVSRTYKNVEELTGISFGKDYLWHVFNPDKSDWHLDSEIPAIALCVFKEYYPERQVEFAADLQFGLHCEGRDLTDDEAYRHLLEKYNIPPTEFYEKLRSENFKESAYYEFALCKQLQVTGFPAVMLQVTESKFYLLSRGYTDLATMKSRLDNVLLEIKAEKVVGSSNPPDN
jgi:putative protein-disulfide isomerase